LAAKRVVGLSPRIGADWSQYPRPRLLTTTPVLRLTAVMRDGESDDDLVGHPVDERERERGENLAANRGERDRRRLWKGLDLLDGALDRVEEGAAQPGILCIVEVGRLVELALCGRIEAYGPGQPRFARACATTSSPGMVSTSPATMAS
jgi:hypothetical protein